jgi:hypothetical protein
VGRGGSADRDSTLTQNIEAFVSWFGEASSELRIEWLMSGLSKWHCAPVIDRIDAFKPLRPDTSDSFSAQLWSIMVAEGQPIAQKMAQTIDLALRTWNSTYGLKIMGDLIELAGSFNLLSLELAIRALPTEVAYKIASQVDRSIILSKCGAAVSFHSECRIGSTLFEALIWLRKRGGNSWPVESVIPVIQRIVDRDARSLFDVFNYFERDFKIFAERHTQRAHSFFLRLIEKVSNDDIAVMIRNCPERSEPPACLQFLFATPLDARLNEEWLPPFSATLIAADTVSIQRIIPRDEEMRWFKDLDNSGISFIKMHAERRRQTVSRSSSEGTG